MLVTLSARTREKSRIIERRRRFFPSFAREEEGKVFWLRHISAYISINGMRRFLHPLVLRADNGGEEEEEARCASKTRARLVEASRVFHSRNDEASVEDSIRDDTPSRLEIEGKIFDLAESLNLSPRPTTLQSARRDESTRERKRAKSESEATFEMLDNSLSLSLSLSDSLRRNAAEN